MSGPSLTLVQFELQRGVRYRKVVEVLAFQSGSAFTFDKDWGTQVLPAGSWLIVPLAGDQPTKDIYGCHSVAFQQTYVPAPSGVSHRYVKQAVVHAYQPGVPFYVRTVVEATVEVERNVGSAIDWLVMNVGGEVYVIKDAVFRSSYVRVEELTRPDP